MLDKVYGEVILRRREIRSRIVEGSVLDVELDEFWNASEDVAGGEHVGVDAGRNYEILRGNTLAVVNAGAMGKDGLLAHREFVDFIVPPGYPDVRVTNYDVILKTKVILDLLGRGIEAPILVDGSFESDVSKPRWGRLHVRPDDLASYDLLSVPILSQSDICDLCGDDGRFCYTELEFAEKLLLLRKVSESGSCIYISKSTDASHLARKVLKTGTQITDLDLLYVLDPPPGYTDLLGPYVVSHHGLGEAVGEIEVYYVRLSEGGPILRIEMSPGSWDISELFPILKGRQMDGYPYWLARIDKEVRVTRADLKNVLTLLGLDYLPSGREVLL